MRCWAIIVAAVALAGCANAPAGIARMDTAQVRAVPDHDLCFAVAHGMSTRRDYSNAAREVARRGLTCADEVAATVSDCRPLTIVNPDARPYRAAGSPDGPDIVTYQIANASGRPMQFRIHWGMVLSRLQRIDAAEGAQVTIPIFPEVAARLGSGTVRPMLQDCTVRTS